MADVVILSSFMMTELIGVHALAQGQLNTEPILISLWKHFGLYRGQPLSSGFEIYMLHRHYATRYWNLIRKLLINLYLNNGFFC